MKEFNFNTDISYNENQYVLMSDGSILEVGCEPEPSNPFGSMCAGNYGYGEYDTPAYKDAWDRMSDITTSAIENKVAEFLLDNMKVENFPETEDTRASIEATFPGVKGLEKMVLEIDEDYNDIVVDKNADYLLELVQRDYYDPFCGLDGKFSPKEMFEFCENNNIDLSNIVLTQEMNIDRGSMCVVFIEAKSFKEQTDIELAVASAEQKSQLMNETLDIAQKWNNGEVYQWFLYDRDGDIIDSCSGFYGEDSIKNCVENFDGVSGNDIRPVKDLGTHDDIAKCLYANRNELAKAGDER